MQRFPMTPAGYARMKNDLEHLKRVERPATSAAIEEARAHGDLKENAEYHAAREKQGMIEAKIRAWETKVSLAEVIDPEKLSGNRITFGATVTLLDLDTEEETTWSIVGEDEADFEHRLLNFKSPIARAILGKEEGDEVEVDTGSATRSLEIMDVVYQKIELTPRD